MFTLPAEFSKLISQFAPLFSTEKVFNRAGLLMLGAILTKGKRTVCSVLRSLGLKDEKGFYNYHRVLSRARWSAYKGAKILLFVLIMRFCHTKNDPLVFVLDETIERRWGKTIRARGIYRDSVRSSKSHVVKCSGLRWLCLMFVTPVSWANRIWALPFMTVLAPSKRYYEQKGKVHKKLTDWARQLALQLSRWLPLDKIIMLGDHTYAVLNLLASTMDRVIWIVSFRMDAALYDPPPSERPANKPGRKPIKGKRQPNLKERLNDPKTEWQKVRFSQWYGVQNKLMEIATGTAIWYSGGKPPVPCRWVLVRDPEEKLEARSILCTDIGMTANDIVCFFTQRWNVEVTFEEVRAHLGVETQRQWSDSSIARTTPVLMSLYSLVTIWADCLSENKKLTVFKTAWYQKEHPTFSDAIASVRYRIWRSQNKFVSLKTPDTNLFDSDFFEHLIFMAARAG